MQFFRSNHWKVFLENSCSWFFKIWEKITKNFSKILEKRPAKVFISSKVTYFLELYKRWTPSQVFLKAFANFTGTPIFRTTLNGCFWVFTERYFRTSCNKFYSLFSYIKTTEWNKRRQNFDGQIKKHTCKWRWNWSSSKCTWQTWMLS